MSKPHAKNAKRRDLRMIEALDIQVKGIVQGVGFRPFVYRLAKKYLINGWVLNGIDGVSIHAEGESKLLDEFVLEISDSAPAASRVEEIELKEVPLQDFDSFEIRFSDDTETEKTTLVSPDLATCDDCVRELFDPQDRRYRYPFINCTNCGPRFTIIDSLPYDRKSTSMRAFPMCPSCAHEYADPLDRRFHAQPDACFACGPHLTWCVHEGGDLSAPFSPVKVAHDRTESDGVLAEAAAMLRAGKILAVKGLGGFHLACDAENAEAVAALRVRKRREGKAFAVMMTDAAAARRVCLVDEAEEALLSSAARPIVLLRKRPGATFVPGLADALPELGVMLPCTPVQHLLMHDFAQTGGTMLVMTSGNVHDNPIVTSDEEACRELFSIADGVLGNDRDILTRFDDSVVRVISVGAAGEAVQFIRRARGYAPLPLPLASAAPGVPEVFATGPEQKNTFTLTRPGEAFVSQHIGDMENVETFDAWLATKQRYERLFDVAPKLVAADLHPEYLSSKWAHDQDLPVMGIQHHHAHAASVLGEHGLEGPACAVTFDGTGFGPDGALWGGEVLLANQVAFERFAQFSYAPMPGGAAAIKHPLRMAYGVLWAFDLLDHPAAVSAIEALGDEAAVCAAMIEEGLNCPTTSSVGRLFDAASALLGVCVNPTYEGEPAILLEAAMGLYADMDADELPAESFDEGEKSHARIIQERYMVDIVKNGAAEDSTAEETAVLLFDAGPVFKALLDDKEAGVDVGLIARRFHDAMAQAVYLAAELVRSMYDISLVTLSGGVFMNRYLIERVTADLELAGFTVGLNRELPPNDGCVSFGQAVVATARLAQEGAGEE